MDSDPQEFEFILLLIKFHLLDVERVRDRADQQILEAEIAEEPWLALSVCRTLQDVESALIPLIEGFSAAAVANGIEALRLALEEGRIELRHATRALYEFGLEYSAAYEPIWEAGVRLDDDLDEVDLKIPGFSKTTEQVREETLVALRRLPGQIRQSNGD